MVDFTNYFGESYDAAREQFQNPKEIFTPASNRLDFTNFMLSIRQIYHREIYLKPHKHECTSSLDFRRNLTLINETKNIKLNLLRKTRLKLLFPPPTLPALHFRLNCGKITSRKLIINEIQAIFFMILQSDNRIPYRLKCNPSLEYNRTP